MNTDVILCIISVCAIFSPVITSVIDNIFKIYLRDKKVENSEKRKILNEFINATMECITSLSGNYKAKPDVEVLKSYYKASKSLMIYYPKLDTNKLERLDNQIDSGDKELIFKLLEDILDDLIHPI